MPPKIHFIKDDNAEREFPDAFSVEDAMFKVNGAYVCGEPCGGGDAKHLLGNQYVYVASDGNDDSEAGALLAPFLTVAKAMEYINTFVTIDGDVYIMFKDVGPFYINSTLKINHQNRIFFVGIDAVLDDPPPDP